MELDVDLVEGHHKRHLILVEETAAIKHVGHEGLMRLAAHSVDDVRHHGRKGGAESVSDDRSGCRPVKNLDLTGRVNEDVP